MEYSFVVPIFNDGALAADLCLRFEEVFAAYVGRPDIAEDVELIFVDDGSRDDSVALIKALCDQHAFVKGVALSRNFGQHIAVSCGYRHARGRYVGMFNVDQEDPPDQLPVLLDAVRGGTYDIVGGLYSRRDVPLLSRLTSHVFNVTLNRLTGYDAPINASTCRVMTRRFVDAYNSLSERSRYIPGLELWLGFKYGRVPVRHQRRRVGKSSYNFSRRWRMALESIISFSDFPLRLAMRFGVTVAVLGFLTTLGLIIDKLFFVTFLPGYLSILTAVVCLVGLQIMFTGLVALYIGRILAEVQGRPLYIVRETYGEHFGERAEPE